MDDTYNSSVAFLRLRWNVKDAHFAECVQVLDDPEDPKSPQQPFVSSTGKYHAVSEEAVCVPPARRLVVVMRDLDGYEPDNIRVRQPVEAIAAKKKAVREECGLEDWAGPFLVVESAGEFITIGEYVAAVHPWLCALRPAYVEYRSKELYQKQRPDMEYWIGPWDCCTISTLEPRQDPINMYWQNVARIATTRLQEERSLPPKLTMEDELRITNERPKKDEIHVEM